MKASTNSFFFSFIYSGLSPCPSPLLQICPSPDSSEDRSTPKFYISKLYSSSLSSSPTAAPSPSLQSTLEMQLDLPNVHSCGSSSSSSSSSLIKPSFEMFDTPTGSDAGDSNAANDGECQPNGKSIDADNTVKESIQNNNKSNGDTFVSTTTDGDGNEDNNNDKNGGNDVERYDDIKETIDNKTAENTNLNFIIAETENGK